jgi:hypothetical protein
MDTQYCSTTVKEIVLSPIYVFGTFVKNNEYYANKNGKKNHLAEDEAWIYFLVLYSLFYFIDLCACF